MDSSHFSRRIFFWLLTFLFFITAPTVIFFSFGYRFSFERGVFIYAGSLTLKPNPSKITLLRDGQPLTEKQLNRLNNSYHVTGLKPGEHTIAISADGFQAWSKKITVHSGLSTEFWNVLLARTSYDRTDLGQMSGGRFFLHPQKNRVAFVEEKNNTLTISILFLDTNERREMFRTENYRFSNDVKENIEWSPDGNALLVPLEKIPTSAASSPQHDYGVIDVEQHATRLFSTLITDTAARSVRWDPKQKNVLYYISNGTLFRSTFADTTILTPNLLAHDVAGYAIADDGVYYLHATKGLLYRIPRNDTDANAAQLTTTSVDLTDPSYTIIAYDAERIVLFNRRGALYIFNDGDRNIYFEKIADGVRGASFSDDGKKMVYWTNNELYAYFTRDWDTQPLRAEHEHMLLTRFTQTLSDVQWTKDFEHVLFTVGRDIKVIELDHRDHRNVMTLSSLNHDNANVVSDFDDGKIYFLDTYDNRPIFFSIAFPEKEGLFGL